MVTSIIFIANKNINIEINTELNNRIKKEYHLLSSLLLIKITIKFEYNLFKHNILYLEQITFENNTLLTWKQIVELKK